MIGPAGNPGMDRRLVTSPERRFILSIAAFDVARKSELLDQCQKLSFWGWNLCHFAVFYITRQFWLPVHYGSWPMPPKGHGHVVAILTSESKQSNAGSRITFNFCVKTMSAAHGNQITFQMFRYLHHHAIGWPMSKYVTAYSYRRRFSLVGPSSILLLHLTLSFSDFLTLPCWIPEMPRFSIRI